MVKAVLFFHAIQKLVDENEMSFRRKVIRGIEFVLEHQKRENENIKMCRKCRM